MPPAALRAARVLVGLPQAAVADQAHVSVKSLRAAERDLAAGGDVNGRLRGYFEGAGLEFLGTVELGSGETSGVGVRWREAQSPCSTGKLKVTKSSSNQEFCLEAARAFLDETLADVARQTSLDPRVVRAAEIGMTLNLEVRDRLLQYYRGRDLLLLGRRDLETNSYVGVGVRHSSELANSL